jgi:hypothetical protein
MNLGAIIEVAIGVVFIWLILSLSTIQIQEWIASLFKLREKDLEKAIGQMLANPKLTEEFYKHPLIKGLSKKLGKRPAYIPPREFAQTLFNIIITAGTENSAIQQMLASLKEKKIGELLPKGVDRKRVERAIDILIKQAGTLISAETGSIIDQFKNLPVYKALTQTPINEDLLKDIPPEVRDLVKNNPQEIRDFIENIPTAVTEYINACKEIKIGKLAMITPDIIEKGIAAIGKINPDLEHSLNSMITGAEEYVTGTEHALTVVRNNVESWFNSSMESLSGRYRRRSQIIAFFIGLFLATMLSVNTIALVQRLWIDPTLRAALLENASAFLPDATSANQTTTGTPSATETATAPATDTANETGNTGRVAPGDTIRNFQTQFEGLELPLGWISVQENSTLQCALFPQWVKNVPKGTVLFQGITFFWNTGVCYRPIGTTVPLTSTKPSYEDALKTNWLFAWFIGVLLSAAATTQGAPFWFDILNKLINLRGAGTPPPTTQESTLQK